MRVSNCREALYVSKSGFRLDMLLPGDMYEQVTLLLLRRVEMTRSEVRVHRHYHMNVKHVKEIHV